MFWISQKHVQLNFIENLQNDATKLHMFEFGAVQKYANIVDLEHFCNCSIQNLQNEYLVAKIDFGTADNGPSKVWATNPDPSP